MYLRRYLIVFCALALLGVAPPATPTVAQMTPYLHPQRLVNIGGRRLNIYCTGTGSPTVILDSGLGGTTADWYKVQGPIARYTRACSYDRAGMGFSDGTASTRDPDAVVSDLHALLHRAGIEPPYVLVGHSIAGLYEPLYADRYPSEVAGMVLVDPSRPFQTQRFAAVGPALVKLGAGQSQLLGHCYAYLSHGDPTAPQLSYCGFPTAAQQRAACAKQSPGQCALDKVQNVQWLRPLAWHDELSELDSISGGTSGSVEVNRAQRFYGSMPLIILTADNRTPAAEQSLSHIPKSQVAAISKVWKAMHDQLARFSSIGVNFVVRDTGHYIQQDQPAVVISAVDEVVDQARARK